MSTTYVVLVLLAVWRLARLIAVDEITRPLRAAVDRRSAWAGYLVSCPWCISIWMIPLALIPVWWPDNRAVFAVVLGIAASGIAGLLVSVEDRLDR